MEDYNASTLRLNTANVEDLRQILIELSKINDKSLDNKATSDPRKLNIVFMVLAFEDSQDLYRLVEEVWPNFKHQNDLFGYISSANCLEFLLTDLEYWNWVVGHYTSLNIYIVVEYLLKKLNELHIKPCLNYSIVVDWVLNYFEFKKVIHELVKYQIEIRNM